MKFLSISELTNASLPSRSMGEGVSALDLDQDGSEELLVYLATTRQPGMPSFNDVAIFRVGPGLALDPQFEILGADDSTVWPTAEHDQSKLAFSPSPLQTSWLQDTRELDFNGDGVPDLLIGDHGAEWPASGFDDYESDDWSMLYETDPAFRAGWPGGDVQVVLSGQTPEVVNVTNERAFWHQTAAGDVDGDGDPDIITGEGAKVRLFLNDGSGQFSRAEAPIGDDQPASSPYNFSVSNIEVADLDQDGVGEMVFGPTAGRWLDTGPGLWVVDYDPQSDQYAYKRHPYPEVENPRSGNLVNPDALISDKLTVGDYDNDGDTDVLVKLSDDDAGGHVGTFIYRNDGDSGLSIVDYEPPDQVLGGDGGEFVDVNGDGLLDIVYPGWPANQSFEAISELTFLNRGNDEFTRLDAIEANETISVSKPHPANPDDYLADFRFVEVNSEPLLFAVRYGEYRGEAELTLASMRLFDDQRTGSPSDDAMVGDASASVFVGQAGDDRFAPGAGSDRILAGDGQDIVELDGQRDEYQLVQRPVFDNISQRTASGWAVNEKSGGNDNELLGVERVLFAGSSALALDLDAVPGAAYRLYEASFDRAPDPTGLGYWIAQLEGGLTTVDAAARFIDSAEFRGLYGEQPADDVFVETLYRNILDRDPDSAGLDWWANELGSGGMSRPEVLARFSDSAENREGVEPLIAAGIAYDPWNGAIA